MKVTVQPWNSFVVSDPHFDISAIRKGMVVQVNQGFGFQNGFVIYVNSLQMRIVEVPTNDD